MIIRVNVVLNRIDLLLPVTDGPATCAVVFFRVKVNCNTSANGIKKIDLIGQ